MLAITVLAEHLTRCLALLQLDHIVGAAVLALLAPSAQLVRFVLEALRTESRVQEGRQQDTIARCLHHQPMVCSVLQATTAWVETAPALRVMYLREPTVQVELGKSTERCSVQ